jgi:hypothetical protein
MRIAVTLNGTAQYVASLSGAGFLSAHLNLSDRPKEQLQIRKLRVQGSETGETATVSVAWPELKISAGDIIELSVLEDGPGDPPASRRSSSESPDNLFGDVALAKEALAMCNDFGTALDALLVKSRAAESEEEYRKIVRAAGNALADLGQHLMYPIFRRHAELVPQQMRGALL